MTKLEQDIIDAIRAGKRTLGELAEASGVHRVSLSKFVNGKAGLTSESLGKLVDVLGLRLVGKQAAEETGNNAPKEKPFAELHPYELLAELGYDLSQLTREDWAMDPERLLLLLHVDHEDPHSLMDVDPDDDACLEPDTTPDGEDPYRPPKGAEPFQWCCDHEYRRRFREEQAAKKAAEEAAKKVMPRGVRLMRKRGS